MLIPALICLCYKTFKYELPFYILMSEGIRFMQNVTTPVFVKCPRFEAL